MLVQSLQLGPDGKILAHFRFRSRGLTEMVSINAGLNERDGSLLDDQKAVWAKVYEDIRMWLSASTTQQRLKIERWDEMKQVKCGGGQRFGDESAFMLPVAEFDI
ncbi:hypothetical protein ACMFMF_003388 [Clarireedia jacksonii]